MTLFFVVLAALLVGNALRKAGLPEPAKQQEYDRALARRAARSGNLTAVQWFVAVVFFLAVVGLVVRALA
jgi:hypothetical protein